MKSDVESSSNRILTQNPCLKPTVEFVKEKNCGYIYDEENASIQVVNGTALSILELCDGTHTLSEIITILSNIFSEVPKKKLQEDVTAFMIDLTKRDLVIF